jgi:GTPase SAR1 family protein
MHKKKAKILIIGDAASGKSSLIQSYVKKNYQFSSDYIMVLYLLFVDSRSLNIFQNYSISIVEY